MYSVLLMAAFTAAPDAPAGLLFHRRQSAGCTGTTSQANGCSGGQAYALVPMQSMQGCAGGFAQGASAGCAGGFGGQAAYREVQFSPSPQSVVFVQQSPPPRRFLGYRQVCRGTRCELVAVYD